MSTSDLASQLMQQDPRFIEQVMEILHTMQREQPDKFSGMRFKIEPRVEREQSKMQHFGSYEGPDDLTYQLLHTNFHTWNVDPHTFWNNPTKPFWGNSATAQRMACIVLELMFRELGRPQIATFTSLVRIGRAGDSPLTVQKYVEEMLDHGSRYLNMEANMGRGICFVLGCTLPEAHWYKLLPKKDAAFNAVMDHLRSVGMEPLATLYAPIRDKIVESRMASLRAAVNQIPALPVAQGRNTL